MPAANIFVSLRFRRQLPRSAASIIVALLLVATAGCRRHHSSMPVAGQVSPSSAATSTPQPHPVPRVGTAVNLPLRGATAAAALAGRIWLAAPVSSNGPLRYGALVELDSKMARVERHFTVGGNPTGIAVTAGYVWVANGAGDARAPVAYADTIVQISTRGTLAHRYRVPAPESIAAAGPDAWVLSGSSSGNDSMVWHLLSGTEERLATLPGNAAITQGGLGISLCGSNLYILLTTSAGQLDLQQLDPHTGRTGRMWRLEPTGDASLVCVDNRILVSVANVSDGGLLVYPAAVVLEKSVNVRLSTLSLGRLWSVIDRGVGLGESLRYRELPSLALRGQVQLPAGDVRALVGDADTLWVITETQATPVRLG